MMSNTPAIPETSAIDLTSLLYHARDYAAQSKSDNTKRAYASDWRHFTAWCGDHGQDALPASGETVALYLAALARDGYKAATIGRRVAAISQAHKTSNHPTPTAHPAVKAVWSGIRRAHGTAQSGKAPALTENVRAMVQNLGTDPLAIRDRALLLLGFAGAFRRSELVALDVSDLTTTPQGLIVQIRRSKTDQEGGGREVGIPRGQHASTCPVRAVQSWMATAGISTGPLFRAVNRHGHIADQRLSDKAVALIVKRSAAAAGLDPTVFAGHSLRAGLATSAAAAGISERSIMDQTGHRSVAIARRYIRHGSLFRDNAAGGVGL